VKLMNVDSENVSVASIAKVREQMNKDDSVEEIENSETEE